MTFAFIPKAAYKIGQIIQVHGAPMRVESFTHSGRIDWPTALHFYLTGVPVADAMLAAYDDADTHAWINK